MVDVTQKSVTSKFVSMMSPMVPCRNCHHRLKNAPIKIVLSCDVTLAYKLRQDSDIHMAILNTNAIPEATFNEINVCSISIYTFAELITSFGMI